MDVELEYEQNMFRGTMNDSQWIRRNVYCLAVHFMRRPAVVFVCVCVCVLVCASCRSVNTWC